MDHHATPQCVGFIMDGNRRWAREQGHALSYGHKRGYERVKEVMKWVREAGISHAIFYTFSTENWNRAKEEVAYLMHLFAFAFKAEFEAIKKEGMRIQCIGDLGRFSKSIQKIMRRAEEETKDFAGPTIVFAMSYGGRDEILQAVKKVAKEKIPAEIEKMTEVDFAHYLYTKDIPDPDLIIRTSGEMRLSGFLPWQGVYSELFFTKTYWPAFSKEEFFAILKEFGNRERRIGK